MTPGDSARAFASNLTDPVLIQAAISMQVPYYPNAPGAYCIDAKSVSFA